MYMLISFMIFQPMLSCQVTMALSHDEILLGFYDFSWQCKLRKCRTWTMAHGHLVVMGGISTVDGPSFETDGQVDPRSPVLTFEAYTKIEEKERLDQKLRKISEENIKNRRATFSPSSL